MEEENQNKAGLEVQPIKMTRKVSFRDEMEGQKKDIADVHLVECYKNMQVSESKGFSCLKCQIF